MVTEDEIMSAFEELFDQLGKVDVRDIAMLLKTTVGQVWSNCPDELYIDDVTGIVTRWDEG